MMTYFRVQQDMGMRRSRKFCQRGLGSNSDMFFFCFVFLVNEGRGSG